MSLLQQESRAETLKQIKWKLIAQTEEIENESPGEQSNVEQVIYSEIDHCQEAGKPLPEFEVCMGTVLRNLQRTLEDLQDYQKQQELWIQHQQKLLSEQAAPDVLLKQRLHYREYKIREIIDSTNKQNQQQQGLNANQPSNNNQQHSNNNG